VHRAGSDPVMLARLNSAGWCSDRIRTLNQDIADVLFTDASDAPQRLGSETSAAEAAKSTCQGRLFA